MTHDTSSPNHAQGPEIRGNDSLLREYQTTLRASMDVQHEGSSLVEPLEFTIERDNNRPLRFKGRLVGANEIDPEAARGTLVTVFVTQSGKIITSVYQWQRDSKRERERYGAAAHTTAEEAFAWLIEDGGGHLGRASREAWDCACQQWPPLQGYEVEIVE